MKTTFRAVVRASEKHVLIGGIKTHKSSYFNSREEAQVLLDVIVDCNEKAGREMSAAYVFENRNPFR